MQNYASAPDDGNVLEPAFMPNGRPERCEVSVEDSDLAAELVVVSLSDMGIEVTMARCQLRGAQNSVQVFRGAVLHMRECSVADSGRGLVVGESDVFLAKPCGICGMSGDAALARVWDVARGAWPNILSGAVRRELPLCAHTGAISRAWLDDVDIRGCSMEAVHVDAMGVLTAVNVRITTDNMGFVEAWVGERKSTFQGYFVRAPPRSGVVQLRKLRAGTMPTEDVEDKNWELVDHGDEVEGVEIEEI